MLRGWRQALTYRVPYTNLLWSEACILLFWTLANAGIFLWQFLYELTEYSYEYPHLLSRISRSLGHVSCLNLGLLLLPVARNSIWLPLIGTSFERFIMLHRWCARFLLLSITSHLVLWWILFFELDVWRTALQSAWITCVVIELLAYEWFRRNTFELFYYVHHLFVVFIGLAIAHTFYTETSRWEQDLLLYYTLPGIVLYAADRLIRWQRSRVETDIVSLAYQPGGVIYSGKVTRIEVLRPGFQFKAGQYCFINVPELSLLEWHPFSISSAPNNDNITFHIQAKNQGSWSDKLYQLAAYLSSGADRPIQQALSFRKSEPELAFSGTMEIKMDGPYGNYEHAYDSAEVLLLICGGIGITPLMSIVSDLVHKAGRADSNLRLKKLYLFWICKRLSHYEWFMPEFEQLQLNASPGIFEFRFHATQEKLSGKIDFVGSSDEELDQVYLNSYFDNRDSARLSRKAINEKSPLLQFSDEGRNNEKEKEKEEEYQHQSRRIEKEKEEIEILDLEEEMNKLCIPYKFGRPDWDGVFDEIKQQHCPWQRGVKQEVVVLCCGPEGLRKEVSLLCSRKSDSALGVSCCGSKGDKGGVSFSFFDYTFFL